MAPHILNTRGTREPPLGLLIHASCWLPLSYHCYCIPTTLKEIFALPPFARLVSEPQRKATIKSQSVSQLIQHGPAGNRRRSAARTTSTTENGNGVGTKKSSRRRIVAVAAVVTY